MDHKTAFVDHFFNDDATDDVMQMNYVQHPRNQTEFGKYV